VVQKYKMINLLDILQDGATQINKEFVSYYQNIHGVTLPIEVQRIISCYDDHISYNDDEYIPELPEKWCDRLEFFGFDIIESEIIPLLFLSESEYGLDIVCYIPKEKRYCFKELAWGTESEGYESIIELLIDKDSIMKNKKNFF